MSHCTGEMCKIHRLDETGYRVHTHLFSPYLLESTGVRRAIGRYTHAMMLPSQFTSFRENPKSRATEDTSISDV
jgi:hypothetical protein